MFKFNQTFRPVEQNAEAVPSNEFDEGLSEFVRDCPPFGKRKSRQSARNIDWQRNSGAASTTNWRYENETTTGKRPFSRSRSAGFLQKYIDGMRDNSNRFVNSNL